MERLTVVGAPTSAGAYAPGQEDGPAALRAHGLLEALRAGGCEVVDAGDVEGFRWRPDPERPRAANAPVVADRARQVAERAGAALAGGGRVLVLGGDCTVGVGTVAALAPAGAGLVYLDRHADLNTPATTIDGALDWMGVAHMLGAAGAEPAIAGLAGPPPMLTPDRVAYLALDLEIVAAAERERLDALEPAVVAMEQARADGAGAAAAALRRAGRRPGRRRPLRRRRDRLPRRAARGERRPHARACRSTPPPRRSPRCWPTRASAPSPSRSSTRTTARPTGAPPAA